MIRMLEPWMGLVHSTLLWRSRAWMPILSFLILTAIPLAGRTQETPEADSKGDTPAATTKDDAPQTPEKVDITPLARDDEIEQRLTQILKATGWFTEPSVTVEDGVAFLSGRTSSEKYQTWAGDLASRTQDVAAVVNRIEVAARSIWDLSPAWEGLDQFWRDFFQLLPFIGFGLLILIVSWFAALIATNLTRRFAQKRISAPLLLEVAARSLGFLVFLFGLYIVLRVSGLTRLALTVVGGTGILGLVLGIAFRDITENFLASLFLSVQRPFEIGDHVEIEGVQGYVLQLTVRTTVLMTFAGNHVQIPNSTVYKSILRNFTSNPNRRDDFTIGIGYGDNVLRAQSVALEVLQNHEGVLEDPEPWVLVESLGSSAIILRIYFWIDTSEHSFLKVRSSVIRLVKQAFTENGLSIPDEGREIVFPKGVPIHLIRDSKLFGETDLAGPPPAEPKVVSTEAEGGLGTEEGQIKEQARKARSPEASETLLDGR